MQFTYDLKNMKIDLSQAGKNVLNKLKNKEGVNDRPKDKRSIEELAKMNLTIQDSEFLETIPNEKENTKTVARNAKMEKQKASSEIIQTYEKSESFKTHNEKNGDTLISSFLTV